MIIAAMHSEHSFKGQHLLRRAEGVLMSGAGEAVFHGDRQPDPSPAGFPAPRLSDRGLFAGLSLLLALLTLHMQQGTTLHQH